jgi:hypothetical protein
MITAAREARHRGMNTWPLPLHALEEVAEHLRKLDKLAVAAEHLIDQWERWGPFNAPHDPAEELRRALREVQS